MRLLTWRFGILSLVAALLAGFLPSAPARADDPVSIAAVSPAVAGAGTTVAVAGQGFSAVPGENTVDINGKAATVAAATATQLNVVVPAGATSGPVRVVSPSGSATSPSDLYIPPSGFASADVELTRRLTLGAETTAAVATTGKIALLTIAGQAGRRLSLTLTGSTFGAATGSARVAVYRPDGTVVVSPTGFPTSGVFLGPLALTADGTYQVLIDPQGTAVGQVAVTADNVPADAEFAATAGGAQVTMTTTVPGQNGVLSFPATAGQRVYFAFGAGTFGALSNAKVTVRRPDGTSLISATSCGTSCSFDTTVAAVTGTYTVLLDPQSTYVGSLTARLYDVPPDAASTLAIGGAAQTVTTSTPGQNAVFSFAGVAGDRVYFTFTGGTFPSTTSATVAVRRPDGSSYVSAVYCGTGCTVDVRALPDTGTYTILLDPQGEGIGSLTARLSAVAADSTAAVVVGGAAQTVTTTTPGQNATFSFAGTAGQRVYFSFTGGTFGSGTQATVTVRRPDGTTYVSAVYCGVSCVIDTSALPVTGTYTILLDPQGTVTGSLTAQLYDVPPNPTATLIPGGAAETLSTTVPGQNAVASFAGVAGQRVFFDFSGGTFASTTQATVTVRRPDGTTYISAVYCGVSCVIDTSTLPVTGTYTILLDPQAGVVGALTMRVYDVPAHITATTTVGGPAQAVATTTPGQNATVLFAAEAGQRVSIQLSGSTFGSSTSSAAVTVLRPDGTALYTATGLGSTALILGPVTLAAAGTYTVVVNPAGALTGAVAVRVFDVADATVPTTPGGPAVTATTGTPGQNATVTFPAVSGQRVAIRISGSTYGSSVGSLNASVLAPDGTVLVAASGVGSGGLFIDARVLPATGTYTLLLDPQGVLTGSVDVEVIDVPADVPVTLALDGTMTTLATTVPGQNAVASFTGAAGQRVSLRFTNGTGGTYATIRKPDGTDLKARWYVPGSEFLEPLALPVDGVYTLLVDPPGAAPGSIEVRAWDVPADATATGAVNGAATTVTTTKPGQNAVVIIPGTAGRRMSLRLTGATTAYATITGPNGIDLTARFYASTSHFVEPLLLPASGDYSVRLDPTTYGVGALTVQAWDVPADNAYQGSLDGTATVAAVTVPGQNATVTFTAAAGHRLSVKLSDGTVAVYATIKKPDGTDLKTRWYASTGDFVDPLVTPTAGIYTLVLDPSENRLGTITVRLHDVPADPAATTAFGGAQVESNIVVPGQNATVTFQGAAGTTAYLALDSIGFNSVTMTLLNPAGTALSSVTLYGTPDQDELGPIVLTASGTYTLRINPNDADTGVLRARLYDAALPAPVVAAADGAPAPVAVGAPGQYGRVTFTGNAGQRVSIVSSGDFRDGSTQAVYTVSLISPSGTTIGSASPATSAPRLLGPFTLTAAGSYEVRVNPAGLAVGSATVRIYDVTTEPVLDSAPGAGLFALDLPAAGMTAVVRFPATAGQVITLDYVDGPAGTFSGVLRDPSGGTICSDSTVVLSSLTTCTAQVDGTHEFRLTSLSPETGTWHMEFIDAIGTPVVSLTNPVHPGGWIAERSVTGTFAVAAVTPLAGYSAVVDTDPTTVPAATVTQPGAAFGFDLPSEGALYLHVRGVAANGVAGPTRHHLIRADWTAPAVTSLEIPSHPDPDEPVGSLAVSARFTSASDASGVVGYAVSVTHAAADAATGAPRPGDSYQTTLPAEGEWYLHVAAVDGAGNRGTPWHRKLTADTPPDAPLISSATHPVPGTAYPTQDFVASWTGSRTAWARTWAVSLDDEPDTVPGVASASTETRYGAHLAAGEWWLHVRGVDATGTPGTTAHFRVVVDLTPVRFTAPLAGQTVWGTVSVALACQGPLTVQAKPAGGAWTAVATTTHHAGLCTTAWNTAGSGAYELRALDGTDAVADLPVTVANDADVFDRLAADYQAGLLSATQYVWYALYAALRPEQLPAAYSGADRGDAERAFEVYSRLFDALPASERAEITAWLAPTQTQAGRSSARAGSDCAESWRVAGISYDCRVSTAHFTFVYPSNRVGPTNPGADRAAFVQTMMDGFEQAWHVYRDSMQYKVPDHLTVVLNPSMPGGLALPGHAMQLSTSASLHLVRHELFHYVQYEYMNDAYFANSWMNWWMEATAAWAAHRVQFWTNDTLGFYHSHLGEYLAESAERFDEGDSVFNPFGPEYGAFIVAEYLEERLQADSVRQTWERLGGLFPPNPGDVILELLKERRIENDVALELEKFRQFAYVLDANGTQVGFHDADAGTWANSYRAPRETVTVDGSGTGVQQAQGNVEIQQSGARYIAIDNPDLLSTDAGVSFTSDDDDVRGSVLRLNANGKPDPACGEAVPVDRIQGHNFLLGGACPRAVFVLVNAEAPGTWGTWTDVAYTVSYVREARVLTNGNLDIGVGRFGNIDDPSGGVGLRLHNRPETESVLYVCWCEGWGVGVPGGIGGSVTAENGAKHLSVEDFSVIGNRAISRVRGPGDLTVTHTVYPSTDPNLFAMQVIVGNSGTTPITPVRYRRVIDWDLNQLQGYETVQHLSGDASFVSGVTNDGYADPDPSLPLTDQGINGWFTDNGPADDGAQIEVDLGTLAPGTSKMFTIYYGIAGSEAAALGSVSAVGAQVYSFGQINADGSPFTAIMAIDGTSLTNPPTGPRAARSAAAADPGIARPLAPSVRGRAPAEEAHE